MSEDLFAVTEKDDAKGQHWEEELQDLQLRRSMTLKGKRPDMRLPHHHPWKTYMLTRRF